MLASTIEITYTAPHTMSNSKEFPRPGLPLEEKMKESLFAEVKNADLQSYLSAMELQITPTRWPKSTHNMIAPRITGAFAMRSSDEMRRYLQAIRESGLINPVHEHPITVGNRPTRVYYDLPITYAAASVYHTIRPALLSSDNSRYQEVDWQEAYLETNERILNTPFARELYKPVERDDEIPGDKIIFDKKGTQIHGLTKEDLGYWNGDSLSGALERLYATPESEAVIPERISEFIMRVVYPGSPELSNPRLIEKGVEHVLFFLNRNPDIENLEVLRDTIQQLQQEK